MNELELRIDDVCAGYVHSHPDGYRVVSNYFPRANKRTFSCRGKNSKGEYEIGFLVVKNECLVQVTEFVDGFEHYFNLKGICLDADESER